MTQTVQQPNRATAPGELVALYRDPPDGLRVNMIMSLDGAAAFGGVAGPLSDTNDQNLLLALRGYADVVLVGAGTVRAEGYGPARLTADQSAERRERWGVESAPPIAVVTHTGPRACIVVRRARSAPYPGHHCTPGARPPAAA